MSRSLHALSAPSSRRLPPEPESRSVEEVLLQRRLAQIAGATSGKALKLGQGSLPPEQFAGRAVKSSSTSELQRRKHRLPSSQQQRERAASPGTALNPLPFTDGSGASTPGFPLGLFAATTPGFTPGFTPGPKTSGDMPLPPDSSGGFSRGGKSLASAGFGFAPSSGMGNPAFGTAGGLGFTRGSDAPASAEPPLLSDQYPFHQPPTRGPGQFGVRARWTAGATSEEHAADAAAAAEMVAALTLKCDALATRLAQVEEELADARAGHGEDGGGDSGYGGGDNGSTASQSLGSRSSLGPGRAAGGSGGLTAAQRASQAKLDSQLEGVRDKLGQLKNVFHAGVNEEAKLEGAATKLQRLFRQMLCRKRYNRMKEALAAWRRGHSAELLPVLQRELDRQRKIAIKMEQMRVMRAMRLLQKVMSGWEREMRKGQALRHHIKGAVHIMETTMNHRWMRQIVRSWRGVCAGPSSKASCRARNAERVAAARAALSGRIAEEALKHYKARHGGREPPEGWKAPPCVLTVEAVAEEVNRRLYSEMVLRRRYHATKVHFAALKAGVDLGHRRMAEARDHYKRVLLARVFFPWTEWSYVHSRGLDRRQWRGPRRYEVPYNRRRVEVWARCRILRKVVPAWRIAAGRYATARRMERAQVTRFAALNLAAWREQAVKQRGLRVLAVDSWRAKCRRLLELPFRAWFLHVDERKRTEKDNERLLGQHARLKQRQTLWRIMRTWRHQAVFGRVEGLYSRTELMRSLAEQKTHSANLEQHATDFSASMDEARRLLEEEHASVKALESKLEGREREVSSLQMALHHMEQDMVRMVALVDSVSQLYPSVAKHLAGMQQSFGFPQRGLDDLAAVRGDADREEAAEEAAEEAEEWLERFRGALVDARLKRASEGDRALSGMERELVALGAKHEEALRVGADRGAEAALGTAANVLAANQADRAEAALASADAPSLGGGGSTGDNSLAVAAALASTQAVVNVSRGGTEAPPGVTPLAVRLESLGGSSAGGASETGRSSVDGETGRSVQETGRGSRRGKRSSRRGRGGDGEAEVRVIYKEAPPPMSAHERGALERLQFALSVCNFRELSEFGGEELYKEYSFPSAGPGAPTQEDYEDDPVGTAQLQLVAAAKHAARTEGSSSSAAFDEAAEALDAARLAANDAAAAAIEAAAGGEGGSRPGSRGGTTVLSHFEVVTKHVENNESMRQDVVTLHGALEFVRTGNPDALPPFLAKDWRRIEADKTGGYAGRRWEQLTGQSSLVKDGTRTWHDFSMAMAAKMPRTRRTMSVEEKLEVRVGKTHARAELTASGLYGPDKTALGVNPYALSSRKVDDDFRPGTPEPWPYEEHAADQRLAQERVEANRRSLAAALAPPIGLAFGRPLHRPPGSNTAATLNCFQRSATDTLQLELSQGLDQLRPP